jgi:tRNA-specific 2-thiouridylase
MIAICPSDTLTMHATPTGTAANSLGFAKPPPATRVVVAMSGGVDSSAVAALLRREGYDVVGITLQLYDHGAALRRKGACCAGQDIHDAARVAETIGIPHYVLDFESRFRAAVIEDFAESYLAGSTPVPCIRCNQRVKFADLADIARDLGADCLATGHYVRRIEGPDGPELHRAADAARDQSYFLFATTAEQLRFLRFPLGAMASKAGTRALAAAAGLPVAGKPDSQDICFVPEGRYSDVIGRLRPGAAEPGEIVDLAGRVLGTHGGILNFTVGQRKGLGIGGSGEPLHVIRLDPGTRRVIVGPRAALATRRLALRDVNWLGGPLPAEGAEVDVRVRSTRPPRPARFVPAADGAGSVELAAAEEGVAPGQACVFYAPGGTRVLGGGWITRG